MVRLDRARLFDNDPDKYIVSVKDDGTLLADHVLLVQHATLDFTTRCGTAVDSVGSGRCSATGAVSLNWSYF